MVASRSTLETESVQLVLATIQAASEQSTSKVLTATQLMSLCDKGHYPVRNAIRLLRKEKLIHISGYYLDENGRGVQALKFGPGQEKQFSKTRNLGPKPQIDTVKFKLKPKPDLAASWLKATPDAPLYDRLATY